MTNLIDYELNRRGYSEPKRQFLLPTKADDKFSNVDDFYNQAVSRKHKELTKLSTEQRTAQKQAKQFARLKKEKALQTKRRVSNSLSSLFGRSEIGFFR